MRGRNAEQFEVSVFLVEGQEEHFLVRSIKKKMKAMTSSSSSSSSSSSMSLTTFEKEERGNYLLVHLPTSHSCTIC